MMDKWENTYKDLRTNQNLVARLIQMEKDRKTDSTAAAFLTAKLNATGNRFPMEVRDKMPASEKKKYSKCKKCQKKGH